MSAHESPQSTVTPTDTEEPTKTEETTRTEEATQPIDVNAILASFENS
ncbi:MAG: hypothetical protein M3116_04290 [Actinomycetota bacterium]|nr:hypothetical protein [Actinomycetota bacterium]